MRSDLEDSLIFVPQNIKHHVSESSMDALLNHFSQANVFGFDRFNNMARFLFPKALSELPAYLGKHRYYRREAFLLEVALGFFLKAHRKSVRLVHFLNLGNSYHHLCRFKGNHFITGTAHQPISIFISFNKSPWYIERLDGVVLVGPSILEYIGNFNKGIKMVIPHGVNTKLFRPSKNRSSLQGGPLRILFTGSHFRDFKGLASIIDYVTDRSNEVHFHCVTMPQNVNYIRSLQKYNGEQVSFYSGLPVADYVDLYRDSDLFLCPLTDATACNGLNEAMAAGLPVLTTDVGDVGWYVGGCEGIILFKKGDWRGMAEWILDNRNSHELLHQMGASSRIRAETFLDWSVIAPQYTHFFNTVRV